MILQQKCRTNIKSFSQWQ
uniref:Uncharacterized protein n=1 Tax=Anguilla anguilla TaxID=7936 RepID=A0A0E9RAM8_ANGAN